jgi:hypothetical protein
VFLVVTDSFFFTPVKFVGFYVVTLEPSTSNPSELIQLLSSVSPLLVVFI